MTAGVSINKLLVSRISGSLVAHQLPSSVVLVSLLSNIFLSFLPGIASFSPSSSCLLITSPFFTHFCWWPLADTPRCCLWIRPVIRCRPGFGMQDVLVSCGAQRGDEWAEMDTSTRPHHHAHTHTRTHTDTHRGSTCKGWMAGGVGQLRWVFTLSFEPRGEKFDSHSGNNWSHFLLRWQLHLPAS